MPYAQLHYPFEKQELFKRTHPADLVSEGIDQTRGWFCMYPARSIDTSSWQSALEKPYCYGSRSRRIRNVI